MNLAEAFKVAIPDIPISVVKRDWNPKIDPNLVVRETVEDGKPYVNVLIPETRKYYALQPDQWNLIRLYDGERSFAEVAEIYSAESGYAYSAEEARQFAEEWRDLPFWYQTPQERNIALSEKLAQERRHRVGKQSRFSNLTEITFSAWDPDRYLTKLHDKVKFIFSPWFLLLNLAMFAWSLALWLGPDSRMGVDTVTYFDFSKKTLGGYAEFWALMFVVAFVHESCHGLACKHTGAEVHRMGFLLIYLSPAFFCDVTEAWVYGNRWQRVATMVAGLWSEMVLCFFATIVWWGTPSGTVTHRIAYEFILLAGIGAVIINLNPLIKLDGYYIFTEMIGIADLKEKSSDFLYSWVKRHICRLPVEVPYVRTRRALLYVPYALLSELYGYALLFVIVAFAYRIFYRYTPDWAFVPAAFLAFLIFRSRLRGLLRLLKTVYLDKKVRMTSWIRKPIALPIALALLLFLLAPIWKHTVAASFVLEPLQKEVLRTSVPGYVQSMSVTEGAHVSAGATVAVLQNAALASEAAKAAAEAQVAAEQSRHAMLVYSDFGRADQERKSAQERSELLTEEVSQLTARSQIAGVVTTPRVQDKVGAYLAAGSLLAEIEDRSQMRARVYIPEFELRNVRAGQVVSLVSNSGFGRLQARIENILPNPVPEGDPLLPKQEFSGVRVPRFFVATATIANNDGELRSGETGLARVLVGRRSIGGMVADEVKDFLQRKIW
jgi:putative peptide zinc metalloprotease protein